jgi:phosphoribosylformimino-5-aminoimidazole carboxamide ribotide isomerase
MIEIIPAIDIIDGKCVRLTKGEYSTKKVYNENPLEVAREFEANGIKRLHLVDLDGARLKRVTNWKVLESIATGTDLKIDFGGGLRSDADVELAFHSGAFQVTAGSIAAADRETVLRWGEKYGFDKIIIGADIKLGKIAVNAWRDTSDKGLIEFLQDYYSCGFNNVICTDVSKDGVLEGPSYEVYSEIKSELPGMFTIASGGVSDIDDIEILNGFKIDGIIIGKAIYEGRIKLEQLKKYLC